MFNDMLSLGSGGDSGEKPDLLYSGNVVDPNPISDSSSYEYLVILATYSNGDTSFTIIKNIHGTTGKMGFSIGASGFTESGYGHCYSNKTATQIRNMRGDGVASSWKIYGAHSMFVDLNYVLNN